MEGWGRRREKSGLPLQQLAGEPFTCKSAVGKLAIQISAINTGRRIDYQLGSPGLHFRFIAEDKRSRNWLLVLKNIYIFKKSRRLYKQNRWKKWSVKKWFVSLLFCLFILSRAGSYKTGHGRRMLGSPRQLENAVPTNKNPHGVWV